MKQQNILKQIKRLSEWKAIKNKEDKLRKEYRFKDFKTSLNFVNQIGKLAEKQNHHPQIMLTWGKVIVKLWTHEAQGLTEKDIKLAQAIDKLKIAN
jgi:4a-hydroxytetrahydrobiopterin dehydratase